MTLVRDLEWTDLTELAEHERDLFGPEAWSEPTWWAELAARPRRDYLVVTDEHGAVLGYGGIDVAGDTADVMTIATTAAGRGRGLGRKLLDELVRRAEQAGAEALLLEVRDDNEPAKTLYATSAFEVIARRRRYYRGTDGAPDVDALVMRRHLIQGQPNDPDGTGGAKDPKEGKETHG